jgi:hypothetical protein
MRGATATVADVPLVPGNARRKAVLACSGRESDAPPPCTCRTVRHGCRRRAVEQCARRVGRARHDADGVAVQHRLLLVERLSAPIENQFDGRCSARATRSPLRMAVAPDAS